jgi:hypothetical protein
LSTFPHSFQMMSRILRLYAVALSVCHILFMRPCTLAVRTEARTEANVFGAEVHAAGENVLGTISAERVNSVENSAHMISSSIGVAAEIANNTNTTEDADEQSRKMQTTEMQPTDADEHSASLNSVPAATLGTKHGEESKVNSVQVINASTENSTVKFAEVTEQSFVQAHCSALLGKVDQAVQALNSSGAATSFGIGVFSGVCALMAFGVALLVREALQRSRGQHDAPDKKALPLSNDALVKLMTLSACSSKSGPSAASEKKAVDSSRDKPKEDAEDEAESGLFPGFNEKTRARRRQMSADILRHSWDPALSDEGSSDDDCGSGEFTPARAPVHEVDTEEKTDLATAGKKRQRSSLAELGLALSAGDNSDAFAWDKPIDEETSEVVHC